MSKLFENKYYQQLFGDKKKQRGGEVESPKSTESTEPSSNDSKKSTEGGSMSSETTRDRLERIFGGAGRPKGSKNGVRKPKVTGVRKSDAQILAEGKVADAGLDGEGRQQFRFKNDAIAVRDDNGRFIIRQGASSAYMTGLKARPRKDKPLVNNDKATKAFASYWNRKTREAKSFDRKNKLTGKDSRLAAVKRSKTYHMTYSRADPSRHLSDSSEKGYLYLRKERVYRNKDGSVSVGKSGKPRVRRAGPALYDFIGVAPRAVNPRKVSTSAKKEGALAKFQAMVDAKKLNLSASEMIQHKKEYAQKYAASKKSSRRKGASSQDAIAMRNAWVQDKHDALMAARTQLRMPPHVGSVSKAKGVKRGPMSAEKKAAALAKRRATLASKPKKEKRSKKAAASPSSSVSSSPRKERKDKGAKRAPRSQESLEKQRATNLAKKQASARKGMAAMRSRGSVDSA